MEPLTTSNAYYLEGGKDGTPVATPPATSTTTPAASSAVAAPPASATGTTPPPASTPGTQGTTPPSGTEIQDGDWRELRNRYTEAKAKAEKFDALGMPEADLTSATTTYTKIHIEASTLAKALGYDDADFKDAFASDPVKTLQLLRAEKAQAPAATPPPKPNESQADYDKRIVDEVAKQTKPFTEHINKQISDAVEARYGTEFTTTFDTALPNTPDSVRTLVRDYVDEHVMSNNSILVAMKARGDYTGVQEAVKLVAGRLTQVFKDWNAAEMARTTGGRQTSARTSPVASGTTSARRPTIDEIIEDPGLIGDQYR